MTFIRKIMDALNMDNWDHTNEFTSVINPANVQNNEEKYAEELPTFKKSTATINTDTPNFSSKNSFEKSATYTEPIVDDTSINTFTEQIETESEYFANDTLVESENDSDQNAYVSQRMIIKGCHLYFIDISREIVYQNKVSIIPLMREYGLNENDLKDILSEIQIAGIIDNNNNVLMSPEELERFIDIYEPNLFKCNYAVFDKEILMCIGEIIFSDGVEKTYDSLPANEVIDYLNILEKLNVIQYNHQNNQYEIVSTYDAFTEICKSIPNSFSSINYICNDNSYKNVNYDVLTGIEFEKFTAHILAQNCFTNIKITPASGDHGIDILAEKDDVSYAIQCKCYSSNIGNASVQQAHTGKSIYHRDVAVVLTNRYFTHQAIEEANTLCVKLWDRDKLNDMIENSYK